MMHRSLAHMCRWLTLVVVAPLVVGACTEVGDQTPAATPDVLAAEGTQPPPCPQLRRRLDGGCCAEGSIYAFDTDACLAIGPPECAGDLPAHPGACTPRWCADWHDAQGAPCQPEAPDCWIVGRPCSADELAAGLGCEPGWWPKPGADTPCTRVGTGPLLAAPDPDALPDDNGLDPIAPLPALATPSWCWDHRTEAGDPCTAGASGCAQIPRRCQAGVQEGGCLAGEWSPTGLPGSCVPAGVSWTCPPGFVVDPANPDSKADNPLCKPDPADCAPGKWGGITGADVRYVDAAAKANGSGSVQSPFNDLNTAIMLSPPDSVVALADGTYKVALNISKPMTIVGRCAHTVALKNKNTKAVIAVNGAATSGAVTLKRLRLTGDSPALTVAGALPVHAERLFLDRPWYVGARLLGPDAHLSLHDSVIVGVRTQAGLPIGGIGIFASEGASAHLQRVRISNCTLRGLTAQGAGTTMDGDDIRVDGTRMAVADPNSGDAIVLTAGSKGHLRGVQLEGNARAGVITASAGTYAAMAGLAHIGGAESSSAQVLMALTSSFGSKLVLAGGHVRDAQGSALIVSRDAAAARVGGLRVKHVSAHTAIQLGYTASVEVFGSQIGPVHGAGIAAAGAGTSLLLADSVVARCDDAKGSAAGLGGVIVESAARARLLNSRLSANTMYGLVVYGQGSRVDADGLLVDHTLSSQYANANESRPAGIWVAQGELWLRDARISESRYSGLQLQAFARVHAAGVLLDHGLYVALIMKSPNQEEVEIEHRAHGITMREGARATLAGVRSSRMININILVADGAKIMDATNSRLDATGMLVDSTLAEFSAKRYGVGLLAGAHTEIRCVACALVANRMSSAMVRLGGRLRLVHSVIRDTKPEAYLVGDRDGGFEVELADAVVSRDGGHAFLDGCVLADNPRSGLMVVAGGHGEITGTAVSGNGYGVVSEGAAQVTAVDNGVWDNAQANFATDLGLAVPEAPGLLKD